MTYKNKSLFPLPKPIGQDLGLGLDKLCLRTEWGEFYSRGNTYKNVQKQFITNTVSWAITVGLDKLPGQVLFPRKNIMKFMINKNILSSS